MIFLKKKKLKNHMVDLIKKKFNIFIILNLFFIFNKKINIYSIFEKYNNKKKYIKINFKLLKFKRLL